jgi:hypothetical protein
MLTMFSSITVKMGRGLLTIVKKKHVSRKLMSVGIGRESVSYSAHS